jgi:hypothetical protein
MGLQGDAGSKAQADREASDVAGKVEVVPGEKVVEGRAGGGVPPRKGQPAARNRPGPWVVMPVAKVVAGE